MGTVHRARFNIPLVIRYLHRRIHSLTEIVINLKFEIVISCLIPRLQKDSISTDFMEVTLFQMQKMEQIVSEKVRRKRPKQMWFLAVIKIDGKDSLPVKEHNNYCDSFGKDATLDDHACLLHQMYPAYTFVTEKLKWTKEIRKDTWYLDIMEMVYRNAVSCGKISVISGENARVQIPAEHFIRDVLGDAKQDSVQILMAHNPMFAKEYAEWGADVSVCGHTHGGLVRIPGIGSVISPQFELFPKYDAGEFNFGDRKVYVSKGLGTHTFHIRVFDRAEVLMIRINKM